MADVTRKIHLEVMTLDPVTGELIPVPNAKVLIEHDGWFYNPNLSSGNDQTGSDGSVEIDITFDEDDETKLNPFFTISLGDGDRAVPPGVSSDRQTTLPEDWETQHDEKRRVPNITSFNSADNKLRHLCRVARVDPPGIH